MCSISRLQAVSVIALGLLSKSFSEDQRERTVDIE